jgi:hypothetical protein
MRIDRCRAKQGNHKIDEMYHEGCVEMCMALQLR